MVTSLGIHNSCIYNIIFTYCRVYPVYLIHQPVLDIHDCNNTVEITLHNNYFGKQAVNCNNDVRQTLYVIIRHDCVT